MCQVTALRRQVRPTSGKVLRKVNLPEPAQDSAHRPPSGRVYSSSSTTAPNGTWWVSRRVGVLVFPAEAYRKLKPIMFPGLTGARREFIPPESPATNGRLWSGASLMSSCKGWPSPTWRPTWTACLRWNILGPRDETKQNSEATRTSFSSSSDFNDVFLDLSVKNQL